MIPDLRDPEVIRDIILGKRQTQIGLTEIHNLREQYVGHETDPDNMVLMLLSRIGELECVLDYNEAVLDAAKDHIATLKGETSRYACVIETPTEEE